MKTFNKIFQGDRVIWIVVAFLSLMSLLAVYSATGTLAQTRHDGNNTFVLLSHAATLAVGLVAMYVAHRVKYSYYSVLLRLAFFVSVPLLAYTTFKGVDLNNAQRVVEIFGVSFQSSDLAKVALIGYLARMLTIKQDEIKDFKNAFVPLMLPVLLIVGLILPENLSTAAILFVCSIALLFVGRINLKYLAMFMLIGIFALTMYIVIVMNVAEDTGRTHTWINRIERFINPSEEESEEGIVITDENYQTMHAKIAVASGGIFGKAPGRSTQRNLLPHPYSDFIFAIIVEEYGLAGGVFVIMMYLILLYRAIAIMVAIPQSFGGFLSFGLAFLLVMQAMINMGVAVGLLPVTGQPLPLVSKGGTSMLFTGISIGIILSVSKEVNKIKEKRDELKPATESDS